MRLFLAILLLVPTLTLAKPALKTVTEISEGLITIGMADEIRNECGSIKPRIFRAISHLRKLHDRAQALGYSKAEIDAYVENKQEKARLMGIVRARLSKKGVNLDQPNTYCTVGRAEISAKSGIGRLLRAK